VNGPRTPRRRHALPGSPGVDEGKVPDDVGRDPEATEANTARRAGVRRESTRTARRRLRQDEHEPDDCCSRIALRQLGQRSLEDIPARMT